MCSDSLPGKEQGMSVFSDYLEELRCKKDLKYTDIAVSCNLDTSVVYRWMKGERIPETLQSLQTLYRVLQLTVEEKNKLEEAYLCAVYGEERFHNFLKVKQAIENTERFYQGSKTEESEEQKPSIPGEHSEQSKKPEHPEQSEYPKQSEHPEQSGYPKQSEYPEQPQHPEQSEHSKQPELPEQKFQVLHGRDEIIRQLGEMLSYGNMQKTKRYCLTTYSVNKEIETVFSLFFLKMKDCRLEYIFTEELIEEGLENMLQMAFSRNNLQLWMSPETRGSDNQNRICTDYMLLEYSPDLSEGIFTTYPEWVDMELEAFESRKQKSEMVGKSEYDTMQYMQTGYTYSKDMMYRTFEFEPCMMDGITEQILRDHIYEDYPMREELIRMMLQFRGYSQVKGNFLETAELFFLENGLHYFMQSGRFTGFPYPVYSPLSLDARHELVQKCLQASCMGIKKIYMVKDSNLSKLERFHIEYVKDSEQEVLRLDIVLGQNELERLVIVSPKIVGMFRDFFVCLRNEKYTYTKEETEHRMSEILEHYRKNAE